MKRLTPLLILGFVLVSLSCVAQHNRKRSSSYNKVNAKGNTFLHKQWWIGLKGGVNFSDPKMDQSYAVIVPTNYNPDLTAKKYDRFKPIGTQVSMDINFYYRGFSASFQPGYQQLAFSYRNRYNWRDPEDSDLNVELMYKQSHTMQYVSLPILLRYEMPFGRLSPYIQAGFYSNHLLNANKDVALTGVDESAGGPNDFQSPPVSVGATDLFAKSHYGIVGGAGLYYTLGNVRLNLDIQYRHALSLLNSPGNRYDNDRLAGVGDAMDDLQLNSFSVSMGVLFPLRFLSSGFKSNDNQH